MHCFLYSAVVKGLLEEYFAVNNNVAPFCLENHTRVFMYSDYGEMKYHSSSHMELCMTLILVTRRREMKCCRINLSKSMITIPSMCICIKDCIHKFDYQSYQGFSN